VESVKVFEHHPDGVVAIKFKTADAASQCIELMNGRVFDEHTISALWYDGVTNYNVNAPQRSAEDDKKRIDAFGAWLEADDGTPGAAAAPTAATSASTSDATEATLSTQR